jgi:hypothetical protein
MPRMNFSGIYSTVEDITNITSKRSLIKDAIQWGLDELTSHDLEYLMTDGFFTTIAPYETGTVTVTNGSKTVTGSGTTFTAAMVGRKIRVNDEQAYYKIAAFVGATEITLEVEYGGSSDSSLTYSIYKDEYKLNADVDVYKVLRHIEDGVALGSGEASAFDIINPTPSGEGGARFEIFVGTKLDTYTTGTVTGTSGNKTLTGSSTVWTTVEGLGIGSRITVGENTYTVKSVDSDTQITIYEDLLSSPSGSTYTAHLDNPIILLSDIPDAAENIYYRYQRIPFPLVGDTDIPDLPEKYHNLLVTHGLAWAWMTKDKEEAFRQFSIFNSKKKEMWARIGSISTSRTYRRRSMDERYWNRSGQPTPPSNYGIPLEL